MECGITKQAYIDIKETLQEYWFTVGEKQIIAAPLPRHFAAPSFHPSPSAPHPLSSKSSRPSRAFNFSPGVRKRKNFS